MLFGLATKKQNDMALVVASIVHKGHFQGVLEGVQGDILKKYVATSPIGSHYGTMHQALSVFILKGEEVASSGSFAKSFLNLNEKAEPTETAPSNDMDKGKYPFQLYM